MMADDSVITQIHSVAEDVIQPPGQEPTMVYRVDAQSGSTERCVLLSTDAAGELMLRLSRALGSPLDVAARSGSGAATSRDASLSERPKA
jgi:hypothetical protein